MLPNGQNAVLQRHFYVHNSKISIYILAYYYYYVAYSILNNIFVQQQVNWVSNQPCFNLCCPIWLKPTRPLSLSRQVPDFNKNQLYYSGYAAQPRWYLGNNNNKMAKIYNIISRGISYLQIDRIQ